MQFMKLIQGLCEHLGLKVSDAELSADEFELNADEAQLKFVRAADQLRMETVLDTIPEAAQAKKKLYKQLLTACGLGSLHYGASLALDQDKQEILLYQCFPLHSLSILELEQALDNFLGAMDHYNNTI